MRKQIIAAIVLAAGSSQALAQFDGFKPLNPGPVGLRLFTPANISADGKVVVGSAYPQNTFSTFFPVRFTSAGPENLGLYPGDVRARSYSTNIDGSFVVGGGDNFGFWWVPPGPNVSSETEPLLDVNTDGSVFLSHDTRYEGLGSPGLLPNLPGYTSLIASRLSGDGSNVALTCHFFQPGNGYGYPPEPSINIDQASRWTVFSGTQGLGFLPTGKNSVALGISADGSVVVGEADVEVSPGNFSMRPFRWSEAGGMQQLPLIAGDSSFGEAVDASADGSVVVGASDSKAFVWDAINGTRSIASVLTSHGHDLQGWTLFRADGISDDGKIVTGNAFNAQGDSTGWVANLTDICTPPESVGAVTLGIVAREGGAAPGTGSNFGAQFSPNDLTASGTVAFDASLESGMRTCFIGSPGILSLVALANGSPYLQPTLLRLTGSGQAALRDVRSYFGPPATKWLYYAGPVNSLSLFVESGMPAPSTAGGLFDPQTSNSSNPFLNSSDSYGFQSQISGGNTGVGAFATISGVLTRSQVQIPAPATVLANPAMIALTDSGAVVRTGNVDTTTGPRAILTGGPAPLPSELVVKVGTQVPGESTGVLFTGFGSIGAEGHSVIFFGFFSTGEGLFAASKTSIVSLAKVGSVVDGIPTRTIQSISSANGFALLPNGDAVFVAELEVGEAATITALLRSDASGIHSLLLEGTSKLPGYDICRFMKDVMLVAADGDEMLLLATPTVQNENGIYLLSSGGLTSIARVGQVIDLGPGSSAPITQISAPGFTAAARTGRDGRGTFLANNMATFTAQVNTAPSTFQNLLLRATVSLSGSCPADLNNDGFVDDADFSIFVVAYNILDCADPTMPPGCPADLNNDGVVEDADFSIFVVAYNEFLCP